jgi:hypothetical protein
LILGCFCGCDSANNASSVVCLQKAAVAASVVSVNNPSQGSGSFAAEQEGASVAAVERRGLCLWCGVGWGCCYFCFLLVLSSTVANHFARPRCRTSSEAMPGSWLICSTISALRTAPALIFPPFHAAAALSLARVFYNQHADTNRPQHTWTERAVPRRVRFTAHVRQSSVHILINLAGEEHYTKVIPA